MRVKFREILRMICRVYPASKLFGYVIKGIESKNSRTRIECLDELATLIQRNGMGVVASPSKMFPLIAGQISERDAGVRGGAMNVVAAAWRIVGEEVWGLCGRLSDKDQSLLKEKFKRLPVEKEKVVKKTVAAVEVVEEKVEEVEVVAVMEKVAAGDDEFTLDFDQFENPKSVSGIPVPHVPHVEVVEQEPMLDFVITQIIDTDTDMSINALKHIEKILTSDVGSLVEYVDEIVAAVTARIRVSFAGIDIVGGRLCRRLVNLLVGIFSERTLARSVGRRGLGACVREVLVRLCGVDVDVQLVKGLNVVVVRVLENCDANEVFGVLLEVLNVGRDGDGKFVELVMKCIWKMTKVIPRLVGDGGLNVKGLLGDVEGFLIACPPGEWKRRAGSGVVNGDMPLRTIKTVLHELVGCMDEGVFDAVHEVGPGSCVVGYLKGMVEGKRRKEGRTSPIKYFEKEVEEVAVHGGMAGGGEEGLRDELTGIFERIRDKERTKAGIQELWEFKRREGGGVEGLVEEYVMGTGSYFQGYIRRGLMGCEGGGSAGRRRPVSMIGSPYRSREEQTGGIDKESYKERLEKIQRQFRGDGAASSDSVPEKEKSGGGGGGGKMRPVGVDAGRERGDGSYEALKERLRAMKIGMEGK
jgi:hypothetical protein